MLKMTFLFERQFKEIKELINVHEKNIKLQLKNLGDKTPGKMKTTIQSNKKRPQAGEPTNLENNIDVEHFSNGWGVGNVAKLNKNAKHWAATNYGSNHLVGKTIHGQFEPGNPKPSSNDSRTGRLKKGWYSVHIKNPIPAMNYIEKTVNFVRRQINNIRMGK